MRRGRRVIIAVVVSYAVLVAAWQGLRLAAGDRWWWLGLANTLSLYLLLPAVVLWPMSWLARRWLAAAAASLPLAVLMALYGGLLLPPPSAAAGGQGTRLRVMTYNVNGGNRDAGPVAEAIRAEAPDVVCFQEINPRLADDLAGRLGDDYPYRAISGTSSARRIGLISRYPLRDEGDIPDPDPRHGGAAATVTVGGQEVLVVNAHAAQFGFQAMVSGGNPDALAIASETREIQVRSWLDRIRQAEKPAIVCGDLNLTDQNKAYRLLAGQMQDTFRKAGWGLGHTWPAVSGAFRMIPAPGRLFRLDYIWASPEWHVIAAHVGKWDGQSDHLPMIADVAIGN